MVLEWQMVSVLISLMPLNVVGQERTILDFSFFS